MLLRLASLITLFLLIGPLSGYAQDRITGGPYSTRSPVMARNGMVCTSHPIATQVGIDILKQGGNAIDAAIAVNAALGFLEPTGCGIGGDLFAIVWDAKTQALYGLNASGRSPKGLTLAMLQEEGLDKIPPYGPLPVSVPGTVDGWFSLHERFGTLPVKDLLAPAIAYADAGVIIPPLIGHYMSRSIRGFEQAGHPNILETYHPAGPIPAAGQIYANPFLANTYRLIAKGGREAFYEGQIAKTITDFIQEQGGYLSMQDLADHHAEWVTPVSVNYRGYDVWELPPNGQGIAALQMLQILEEQDFSAISFGSPDHLHSVVEAKKLAFEDRALYYADMDFTKVPVDTLLSDDYARQRSRLIHPSKAGKYSAGEISAGETIYFTIADAMGNMISLIQSNYRGMGSGMVPPGLGFMLQDRGELFTLESGRANTYAPGKRPFHTIIPGFVTHHGKPWLSYGVMGGDFQPQGHVQIVMNMIDYGMDVQEAGDAPRWQHSGGSDPAGAIIQEKGQVLLESGFPYATIREMMARGHKVGYDLGSYGGYQAIFVDPQTGGYHGASESRKDGMAAGY